MSDVTDAPAAAGEALTKKIGPLPGFVWVLIVVGVAYGVYWWRKRGAGTTSAPALAADNPAAVDASGAGPAPGTGTYTGQVNTMPVGQAAVSTNAAWAATAGNALIAAGADPSAVQNALSKYLSGGVLSAQEQALINQAVKLFLLPPEGVLPVNAAPAPKAPTPAAPAPKPAPKSPAPKAPAKAPAKPPAKKAPAPAYTTYTVRSGDSLSAIALRFWGTADWQRLYKDNRAAVGGNPDLIHPGLKLKVATHR